jgi:sulfide dehydrogenase [flavocytochrome c] flavoprotein chain
MRATFAANRRQVLQGGAAAVAAALCPAPAIAQNAARIVVIGGGFGGANSARTLKALNPKFAITLVAESETYTAFPLSNAVLAGLRPLTAQQFGYQNIAAVGVTVVFQAAVAIDPSAKTVRLRNGDTIGYDRLVIAPGVDVRFDAIKGYNEAAAQIMPHAWTDGVQVALLQRQLQAMPAGGVVVISSPVTPVRCPLGPYERASMIAFYLKTEKPRGKVIVLDSKDTFVMRQQFERAWAELYPGMIEWVSLSDGGNVIEVDPSTKTLTTDFESYKADVANVIPPQRAGAIAQSAGVADRSGWCPIDPVTFESKLVPNIHVVGDAGIMGGMPKSAFSANAQAKACAAAVATLLRGEKVAEPRLINTCYSLVAPDYGITVAGVYKPADGLLADIQGAGGVSPIDAPHSQRALEAQFAEGWFKTITSEVFG